LGGTEKFNMFDTRKERNKKSNDVASASKIKPTPLPLPKPVPTPTSPSTALPQQEPLPTPQPPQLPVPAPFDTTQQEEFATMKSMVRMIYNKMIDPHNNTSFPPQNASSSLSYFGSPNSTSFPPPNMPFLSPPLHLAPLAKVIPPYPHTPPFAHTPEYQIPPLTSFTTPEIFSLEQALPRDLPQQVVEQTESSTAAPSPQASSPAAPAPQASSSSAPSVATVDQIISDTSALSVLTTSDVIPAADDDPTSSVNK
jgi:hypothetical protein